MNTFKLKIFCSDKIFFNDNCNSLIIPTPDGAMGILANHENMVVAISAGEMHIKPSSSESEDKWYTAAVSPGFAEVMDNEVSVIVDTAERPEDIDIKRAEEAKERAEEKMRQKESIKEFYSSQASLARAMTRLKTIRDKDWTI